MLDSGGFFRRFQPHKVSWSYFLILLASSFLGLVLLSIYMPLPPNRMLLSSEVYDIHHDLAATFYNQNRRPARLKEIPKFLQKAFLAVEDHRFYQHKGINPGRIIKAAIYNFRHGSFSQGASTITQQLAKNAYLNRERNISRKLKELFYTIKLEMEYPKTKILELYLNQIYFGHGAYGVKVAADTYFQKKLAGLNQAEMALLAGLPRGPAFYSPYNHPQAARRRLRQTLSRMKECGYISAGEFEAYSNQPLSLPGLKTRNNPAPYFFDLLQKEMAGLFPGDPELLYNSGLKVESTLDLKLQQAANQAIQHGLPKLFRDYRGLTQPQGVLIAVDPSNGEIRALVGGTDFNKSQFNRAVYAKRQPGSAFKPILYAAALGNGYTLSHHFNLTPKTYRVGAKLYRPTDHGNLAATGMLSLRNALACSSNVVAVKLLEQVGFDPVIHLAAEMGIHSKLAPLLSMALGSLEVTPLELTAAYIPLANGGKRFTPVTIRRVLDRQGRVLYQHEVKSQPVLDPGVAFLVTQALSGVLKEGGTAANAGRALHRPAAGKTGTTEANRDAWFIGYTPQLVACVFTGCDNNERPLPGAAGRIAAPIWAEFINTALAGRPAADFPVPPNIKTVNICKLSGAIATPSCPRQTEYFLAGTEPQTYCTQHRSVKLKVCARSGLLPGPNCDLIEERTFRLGDAPTHICDQCRSKRKFIDFLRRLFR
jgi:1A family penicillin-binding protein